jgi:outer membrane immunogenic protein
MISRRSEEAEMKKRIITSALFAALTAAPAMAADLPVGAPVYVERPPAIGLWNWTGFYFGGNLGYARSPDNSADITACVTPVPACIVNGVPIAPSVQLFSLTTSMSGVIGGVQAGANWQTGNAVFGIEGDFQGTSQSASASTSVVDINGVIDPNMGIITAANSYKTKTFSTLRGRIGVASGRWLYYITGGGAFWSWSSTLTVTGLGTASFSNFQTGGTLGGGVEFALTDAWTVKAEYLFLQSTRLSNAPFIARPDVVVNTRIRENLFRVGVNYAFFTGSVGCRPHDC